MAAPNVKSMKGLQKVEKDVKEQVDKFNSTQKELQKCISSKTKLDGQHLENVNVKEELQLLEDDAVVYKLIGPVLVKQDLEEARTTVNKRLGYISQEIERYEGKSKELQKDQDKMAEKLMKLQQDYQQQLAKAGVALGR